MERHSDNMEFRYTPKGVCAGEMIIDIEGDIVKNVRIVGGCAGNSLGISSLVKDMKIDDVISKLKGLPCGRKPTSCPDQLAQALESIKEKMA